MKTIMTAGAALLMSTSIAAAGGLDRSGQGIGIIFEDGDYAELSFGSVSPSITGVANPLLGGAASGNIAPSYTQVGMGLKMQFSDQLSAALIYDQPFGASVDYPAATALPAYPAQTALATVESDGLTALVRYEINPSFSVHGGLRYVEANGRYDPQPSAYSSTYSEGTGTGYVIGGAYERDDIAMRIALTYSSEIELSTLEGTAGDLNTTLPESVNIDFQTGIAADTLLFGSVRYVAWDGFSLNDTAIAVLDPTNPTGSILSYDEDVFTYNLGVGRRLSDNLAVSFAVGYEASTGEQTGQLGPTDGFISYQIGAAYTLDSGVEISGGIRYVDIGDAETEEVAVAPGTGYTGRFNDNSAVAIGLKIGYTF